MFSDANLADKTTYFRQWYEENGWESGSGRLAKTIQRQLHYAWGPSDCSHCGFESRSTAACCEVEEMRGNDHRGLSGTDDIGNYQGRGADQPLEALVAVH